MPHLSRPDRWALHRLAARLAVAGAGWLGYVLLFLMLGSPVGGGLAAAAVLPAVLAGWLLGLWGGLVMGLLLLPTNALLLETLGLEGWRTLLLGSGLPGSVVILVLGGVAGRLSDLSHRLEEDLAERRRLEEALRTSEALYRDLYEQGPAGFLTLEGRAGRIGMANLRAAEILGVEREALVGRSVFDLLASTPGSLEQAREIQSRLARGEEARGVEMEHLRPDGGRLWMSVDVVPVEDAGGVVIAARCILQDVSQRRMAEEALRSSEQRYRLLADHATDLISAHSPDGSYLYVSPASRSLLGIEPEALVASTLYRLVHADDRPALREAQRRLLDAREPLTLRLRVRRADGRYVWLETAARSVRDSEGGQAQAIIAVSRDITQRLETEAALQSAREEAERQATLAHVAASLAHELRHPLAVMGNVSFLLRRQAAEGRPPTEEQVARLDREMARANRHISALVEFAEPRRPEAAEVSIPEVLQRVLAALPPPDGVEVVRPSGPGVTARVDEDHLLTALSKLVANAYQAMPQGGRLVMEARQEDGEAALEISDTGTGIPVDVQERVFEPLFTTRSFGLGLGLPTARRLVEMNGGQLELESQPGQGTCLRLRLPR